MAKRGRPTLYQPEYPEQALKLCLLGHTNDEMAAFFGVRRSTLDVWIKKYKEFKGALKEGRDQADSNVAHSLYRRAMGAKVQVDTMTPTGVVKTLTKEYPPDTQACVRWLMNRQPKKWRDDQQPESPEKTVPITINFVDAVPPTVD